jgi:sugar diacid utilization regulator
MQMASGEVHVGADDGYDEPLTLGRLLQERLLRSSSGNLRAEWDDRQVTWCLPWGQVMATGESLAGILVFAQGSQVDNDDLQSLPRRSAAAIVIAGPTGADVGQCAIPVLQVGAEIKFRDLSRLVAELALARETHVLRYGLDVHRALVELLYRGAGVAALCYRMAQLAGCAAVILDPQCKMIAFEQSRDRVLEPGAVAAALRSVVEPPSDTDHRHGAQVVVASNPDGLDLTCVISPILIGGRHDGWVAVIESEVQPHPHDLAEHRIVVEQSATIVGTELLRMRSIEQAEERARGDFVHALLHGRFATAHELEARAAHYGFPVEASFGVIVARHQSASGLPDSVTTLFQLAKEAARLAPVAGAQTLATVVGDVLAVIRQVEVQGRRATPDATNQVLVDYAVALEKDLERRTGHRVPVTWGRAVTGADRIFDSYREARLALGLHVRLGMNEPCGFSDLRVFATLAELVDNDKAQAFARDILAPLRTQRSGGADLEHAIITYIESGGNLNAAARDLHIHRNTMLYKLDRASRLLHLDLRQAEHRFTVWLAHRLDLLFEAARVVDRDLAPK